MLVLSVLALRPIEAQWIPNYLPSTTPVAIIKNGLFSLSITYTKWSGYFSNTYVFPAGMFTWCSPKAPCYIY